MIKDLCSNDITDFFSVQMTDAINYVQKFLKINQSCLFSNLTCSQARLTIIKTSNSI